VDREAFTWHIKVCLEQRAREVRREREEYLRKVTVHTRILALAVCGIVAYELPQFFI